MIEWDGTEKSMKLNAEQRKIGIKYNAMQLLSLDIQKKRYTELQQVYEALNLRNNDKLVNKLEEERNIGEIFTRTVYVDVVLVIADYIDERPEIVELIDVLYSKRCPRIKKTFLEWETQYKSAETVQDAKSFKTSLTEMCYLHFLFYKSEIFDEPDKVLKGFDFEQDRYLLNYSFYVTDKNTFDNALIFCTSSEEEKQYLSNSSNRSRKECVLRSKFFDKYLIKRRNELADYLQIDEESLDVYIHSKMKSQSKDGEASIRSGIVGQIEIFTKDIIANQNGGTSWYNAMTTTGNSKEYGKSILYVPDVNKLIENYFKSYVATKYIELVLEKNLEFTKLTLSRECVPDNYEIVYRTILCMYEMDVLYKMFAIMQKQYYIDFSWEKITNQNLATRYENIISNLEQTINEKEKKINALSQKNTMLSLQIVADNSKQTAPLVTENNNLIHQLEEKDLEIEKLKQQLKWQEEFISELKQPEIGIEKETYNLDQLQNKRYLFVGRLDMLSELKHKFPNSVFMNTDTTNISNIEVDAVVMLIRYMSHSMFYKVKASAILNNTICIKCNMKSIDGILQSMYDAIV